MTQIGTFTPEQARQLWQDYQQRNKPTVRYAPQEVGQHRVFVKNSEAEPIPPYACMEINGTEDVAGRTAIVVRKPTTTSGEYLFNSQYEIPVASETVAGVGWAYRYGVVVMQGDGATEAGDYLPAVGTWTITPGNGPFAVFGVHNAVDDALTGRIGTGSTGSNSTAATTGCPCTVVTGVIDPVPNGFGFTPFGTRKLAYRWSLPGLVDTLNANGFSITESDLHMTWASENVWQSAAITRTCTSAISDDYVLAASPADGYWVVWIEHVDGVGSAACDDEIYWVWKGDQNRPQPDRTNEVSLVWLTADGTKHGDGWIDPPDMCVGCLVPVGAMMVTHTDEDCSMQVPQTLQVTLSPSLSLVQSAVVESTMRFPDDTLGTGEISQADANSLMQPMTVPLLFEWNGTGYDLVTNFPNTTITVYRSSPAEKAGDVDVELVFLPDRIVPYPDCVSGEIRFTIDTAYRSGFWEVVYGGADFIWPFPLYSLGGAEDVATWDVGLTWDGEPITQQESNASLWGPFQFASLNPSLGAIDYSGPDFAIEAI